MEKKVQILFAFFIFSLLLVVSPIFAAEKVVFEINGKNYSKKDITYLESSVKDKIIKIAGLEKTRGNKYTVNWTTINKPTKEYIKHLEFVKLMADAYEKNQTLTSESSQKTHQKLLNEANLKNKDLLVQLEKLKTENKQLQSQEKPFVVKTSNHYVALIIILIFIIIILTIVIIVILSDKKEYQTTLKDKSDTINILKKQLKNNETEIKNLEKKHQEDTAGTEYNVALVSKENSRYQQRINKYEEEIKNIKNEIGGIVALKDHEISELKAKISLNNSTLLDKTEKIINLEDEIRELIKEKTLKEKDIQSENDAHPSNGKIAYLPIKKEA